MKHTHLGRTGLVVSRLCLGTMNFGSFTSDEDAFSIMDRAREAGINFFDTANVYGREKRRGYSEEVVGGWLAQGAGRREDTVIATKVYGMMGDGPNDGRLSARHIVSACEASLTRLGTDRIDLYQMHHVDRGTPWEEIWPAMERLVATGKVIYVGSSNFAGWHIATANQEARRRNFLGLVSEQSLYNLAERSVELEVIPACREYGLGLLPWSPLAGGLLAGGLDRKEGRRGHAMAQMKLARYRDRILKFEEYCGGLGRDPAVVALAWLLGQEAVTAPIVGPRTMGQLESALAALEVELTEEQRQALDAIWPGPGGPAPEAYAW